MGDITKNFSFYEYRPKGANKSWLPTSKYMKYLITKHAEMMQIIRDKHRKGITFNSAVRNLSDYKRLLNAGYFPSPTSDHFFGQAIKIPEKEKFKISKFGRFYSFSVGAVDAVSNDIKQLYRDIVSLNKSGDIDSGQIIYESHQDKGWEWIHISTNRHLSFSDGICNLVGKHKYLHTYNGGKSYEVGIDYGIF